MGQRDIREYPHQVEIDVAWGDMDAFQHVNNTVYLRYFETSRIAFFRELGVMGEMKDGGIGPILGKVSCTFTFPLTFPDRVVVGLKVGSFESDRFLLHHLVWSSKHQRCAAFGEGRIVMFNYRTGLKTDLSSALRAQLLAWSHKSGSV